MPLASVHLAIRPPKASISRTICPFATPPTAGLQLIWPTESAFIVRRQVFKPRRAAGIAARTAGWPATTTPASNPYDRFTADPGIPVTTPQFRSRKPVNRPGCYDAVTLTVVRSGYARRVGKPEPNGDFH